MKKNVVAYIQLFFAMFLGGSSVVVGKLIVGTIPVYLSQVYTLAISLIVIYPIARIKEGSVFKSNITKRNYIFLFLAALSGMFLFRVFLLNGLLYTTAIDSGIITSTGPAIIAILSLFMLKEKIKHKVWIGILICVFGIVLINISFNGASGSYTPMRLFGNLLVLAAVVGECLMSIFRKKMTKDNKPITNTMIIIFFALILFLPLSIFDYVRFGIQAITVKELLALFYYGPFCTTVAYLLWFKSVPNLPISSVSGFIGVMPVSSVVLSVIVLKEQITPRHIVGIVLVLLGIYYINYLNRD